MALVTSDKRLARVKPPLMLKEYLCRDDLSSCSSSGFKSFPRRHCCTTVRFLLEIDLKKQSLRVPPSRAKPPLKRRRSKSALHKASKALLNAVKLLPFCSDKSPSKAATVLLLPRSFSKKLIKRSFWWKKDKEEYNKNLEIGRWRLFHQFLKQKDEPSDKKTAEKQKTTATSTGSVSSSTSSDSRSNTNSNSWGGSDFTSDSLPSSSSNSETSSENKVREIKNDYLLQQRQLSDGIGVSVGDGGEEFVGYASKDASNDEGKEQFSPVSVLDCPFDDENHDSSHFQHRLISGTKHKFIQQLRRIDGLSQLQPLDLEKRLPLSHCQEENESITNWFAEPCSIPEERKPENIPVTLERLELFFRAKNPSNIFELKGSEKLLLDFLSERTDLEDETKREGLFLEAEDWIKGKPKILIMGWEVRKGRELYLKEMEKNGSWMNLGQEREEFGTQLAKEIFSFLMDEVIIDFFPTV